MDDTAVVIATCSKFEEVWKPFSILFKKFWPNCPFQVVAITDKGNFPNASTIRQEKAIDQGWSSNLIYGLNKIKNKNIILFLEDFLLKQPVDNKRVIELLEHHEQFQVGCLRVFPCPGPSENWKHDKTLGLIRKTDPYSVSTQVAIWDKETLIKLLKEGETAWEFEANGSERAKLLNEPFISIKRISYQIAGGPIQYDIAILRGKWTKSAIKLLKDNKIDTSKLKMPIKP